MVIQLCFTSPPHPSCLPCSPCFISVDNCPLLGDALSLLHPSLLPQSSELLTEALPALQRLSRRAQSLPQAVWCIAVSCLLIVLIIFTSLILLENKVSVSKQALTPCNLADLSCCVSHNFLICGLDVGHAQQLVMIPSKCHAVRWLLFATSSNVVHMRFSLSFKNQLQCFLGKPFVLPCVESLPLYIRSVYIP